MPAVWFTYAAPALRELASHLLLLVAVFALVLAARRLASLAVPCGLERVLATASIAAAAAVTEALLLGLVGLGTDPIALTAAACSTWVASHGFPKPKITVLSEVRRWWAEASRFAQALLGGGIGVVISWAAWNIHRPDIGIDGVYYHLPEILGWVHSGNPGSEELIHPWLFVSSYPLTHEVLLAWGMGISRSFIPLALTTLIMLALIVVGGAVVVRSLRIDRRIGAVAIAAVLTVPFVLAQVDGPATEVPALAWLVCTAGLAAASQQRRALLAPMLVAAGLAVGSKTTVAPITVAVAALALWQGRDHLRRLRLPLIVAALTVAVVGLGWYLRTTVEHGSPFWPFAAAPWGDPVPTVLQSFHSLLASPRETVAGKVGDYLTVLAGGWLVLAGALLAPLWARTRRVTGCALFVLASLVLWACSPTSGVSDLPVAAPVSQTRYLFGVIALAALTLALAAGSSRRARTISAWILGAALSWSLAQVASGAFPSAFSLWWLLAGGVTGAGIAWLVARSDNRVTRLRGRDLIPLTCLLAALLAVGSRGYLERYASQDLYFDSELAQWFERPQVEDETEPIFMAPALAGSLAGDRIARPIELIPLGLPCDQVEAMRERGWVVLTDDYPTLKSVLGYTVDRCLSGSDYAQVGQFRVYAPIARVEAPPDRS